MLGHEPNLPWPADLYLEGGDQHRGWFHSSLLCAMGTRGAPPYRMVATNGWTLDEHGSALSKSRGNDVDPVDIANRLGGEVVRLWVASVDFREDVVGSEQLMQRVAENYKKIRNSLFRYILGNLYDFDPQRDAIPLAQMQAVDQYMLRQTAEIAEQVTRWYDEFAFHKIYQAINHFCIVELSAFYFDILKDRLYTSAPRSVARRAAQTAIWRIGEALVRLLAPIMSFTCEEVWQYLPQVPERAASVHVAHFSSADDIFGRELPAGDPKQSANDWSTLRAVREEVLKALEEVRADKLIGGGLDAEITIASAEPVYSVLTRYQDQLRYLFIVSGVKLQQAGSTNGTGGIIVQVNKAAGRKCERCWNYSTHVGEDSSYPSVCERCSAVLKEIAAGNDFAQSNG